MAEETDHVKNYQLALRELLKANTRLKDMLAAVQRGGDKMRQWQTVPLELKQLFQGNQQVFMIVESSDSENAYKRGAEVSDWPSRDEVGKALSDQHKALVNARQAFAQVPDARHIGLELPDSFGLPSPHA